MIKPGGHSLWVDRVCHFYGLGEDFFMGRPVEQFFMDRSSGLFIMGGVCILDCLSNTKLIG